jgi:hypothetical protein
MIITILPMQETIQPGFAIGTLFLALQRPTIKSSITSKDSSHLLGAQKIS